MGTGRLGQAGLAIATGVGVVGGMLMAARVESSRTGRPSYEYTTIGNEFIPLPRTEVQQDIGALAGAAVIGGIGTKLAGTTGPLRGAGLAMQSLGLGFGAGNLLVLVMP